MSGPLTGPKWLEQHACSNGLDVAEHAHQQAEFEEEDRYHRERARRRRIEQAQRDTAKGEYARGVWKSCTPASGTQAQEYLASRELRLEAGEHLSIRLAASERA